MLTFGLTGKTSSKLNRHRWSGGRGVQPLGCGVVSEPRRAEAYQWGARLPRDGKNIASLP